MADLHMHTAILIWPTCPLPQRGTTPPTSLLSCATHSSSRGAAAAPDAAASPPHPTHTAPQAALSPVRATADTGTDVEEGLAIAATKIAAIETATVTMDTMDGPAHATGTESAVALPNLLAGPAPQSAEASERPPPRGERAQRHHLRRRRQPRRALTQPVHARSQFLLHAMVSMSQWPFTRTRGRHLGPSVTRTRGSSSSMGNSWANLRRYGTLHTMRPLWHASSKTDTTLASYSYGLCLRPTHARTR